MRFQRSTWWTVVIVAVVFLFWGWFVLGFLSEPSAVGRLRTLLVAVGVGSLCLGVGGAAIGLWMLFGRRT